jgi:UDP-glucose:(heptosyl)LPS alpha-1,3-glucosyltransferase
VTIALLILHADPARGGAERYTIDLAAALRARGHRVSLVASSFGPGVRSDDDVELPTGRGTRARKYVRYLDALDEHLSVASCDIVHAMLPVRRCHVYHPHAGIAAEAVASGHLKHAGAIARTAAKLATRMNARRQKFAKVERALLTGPTPPIVLCLSEYVKKDVTAHYPLAPDRLATLFNAVDLKKFDPAARPNAGQAIRQQFAIPADRVIALMIAQDFKRKGLLDAISGLAHLRDPRLTLAVVGKQDPIGYRQFARELKVEQQVIFAGRTDDPYSFYKAADFFVLPTRHDPCSLVVLEALAMGLPVISSVYNGACETMTTGQQGYVLADPSDTYALVEAFRSLMDPAARRTMRTECLKLRTALSYDRHLEQLLVIYERAAVTRENGLRAAEG